MARDKKLNRELRKADWRVLRIWEHEHQRDSAMGQAKLKRVAGRQLTRKNEGRLRARLRRALEGGGNC